MYLTTAILEKAFSIFQKTNLKTLLIGGQACVFYGAKTATVDLDITILISDKNLENLKKALDLINVEASVMSAPIKKDFLSKGHSLHYYCMGDGFNGIRLDVIGYLPGLDPFEDLWERRYEHTLESGIKIPMLCIKDLIISKKVGRAKDTIDISGLVASHYATNNIKPSKEHIELWLMEMRDAETLIEFAKKFPADARKLISKRPLLRQALSKDYDALKPKLDLEETNIRKEILKFSKPLSTEIKELRRKSRAHDSL